MLKQQRAHEISPCFGHVRCTNNTDSHQDSPFDLSVDRSETVPIELSATSTDAVAAISRDSVMLRGHGVSQSVTINGWTELFHVELVSRTC